MTDRNDLVERLDLIRRDIAELAEQVEAGEVDEATAERLRAGYEEELAEVEERLSALPEDAETVGPVDEPVEESPRVGASPKRVLIGAGILLAAFTAVLVMVTTSADRTPTQPAAAGTMPQSADFAEMEQAVAANPDVIGMRMALADLYFEHQDYSNALNHYLTILDQNPTPEEASHALARVGWLAYATEQNDAAVNYLNQALEMNPDNLEAKLFLGAVDFYGLGDAESAIPLFEEVLAQPDLPPSLRSEVEAALDEARTAAGS